MVPPRALALVPRVRALAARLELLVDELDPEVGVRAVVDLIAGDGVERVGSGESTRQKVSW